MPSAYSFVDGSPYVLNQLFGYQDAEESRQRPLRLRDALALQHRWVNTGTSTPDIGTHYGNVGDVSNPANTVYYGDGSHLINLYKGGWADLTKTGYGVSSALISPSGATGRISNTHFFWAAEYGLGMTNGLWYENWPMPAVTTGTEYFTALTHRFCYLSGTFKLGIISGVACDFGSAGEAPNNPTSYLEMRPYLRNVTGAARIDTASSPVRLTCVYSPEAYRYMVGAFHSTWQFTGVPAGIYEIGWWTYFINVGQPDGPRVVTHCGLDWDMMSRTPIGYGAYFFGWIAQLIGWYPSRPYFGHNLWVNSPMWTED